MSKLTRIRRIMFLFLVGIAVSAQDWNRWRGPSQNGAIDSGGTFKHQEGYGLKLEWKSKFGVSYSSISVAGDQAVTMASDGTTDFVVCLDVKTKKELWKYAIGPAYKNIGPDHDGPNSTPFIENGVVYGLGANGFLFSLKLSDGQEIWKKHLVKDFGSKAPEYGFTTSPIIAEGVLIVQTGKEGKIVSGLDPQSGEELWAMGEGTMHFQSPVYGEIAGTRQVILCGDRILMGINPKTGEQYWQYALKGEHQSNTPLLIGNDRVFIRNSNRDSAMVQVENKDGKFGAREIWTVAQGSGSLADPVYYKGYIYSYSTRFLSCLDEKTGALKWKSRPPGDGFLTLVDDQLVILTRQGVLHIIKASPDAYTPLTSLKVLDEVVWTPPSFANGKVFVRSIGEIATVVLERGIQTAAAEVRPPVTIPKLTETEFGKFVQKLEASADKKAMIEAFMKGKKSPIIEEKEYAHIIFNGPAKDLVLFGDMLETGNEAPLNHVEGTEFWYASFKLPSDARLSYWFNKDFDNRITDPLNAVKVPSLFGECSQLAMPDWVEPDHLKDPAANNKGKMENLEIAGTIFTDPRKVDVYLPAGYETSSEKYPVVYVNYGINAILMGKMVNTLDNLIGKKISPMVVVFIQAPNSGREYARVDKDKHAEMIKEELIPYIDSHFRTQANAAGRAYMGGDEGGYAAFYAALKYPGTFSKVAGQSTHLMPTAGGNELTDLVKNTPKSALEFYLEWGTYDYRNEAGGFNWITYNQEFAKLLKEKGYSVHENSVNEGWGWANWRNRTDRILEFFFPINVN